MELLRNTKKDVDKDDDGENVPQIRNCWSCCSALESSK